jgi:hypothetical protein
MILLVRFTIVYNASCAAEIWCPSITRRRRVARVRDGSTSQSLVRLSGFGITQIRLVI